MNAPAAAGALRIALLYPGDRAMRERADPAESRFAALFQALADAGVQAEPAVWHDDFADEVQAQLARLDGVLVWCNPIEGGRRRDRLDALLRTLAAQGLAVSTHPDTIARLGTKDVLLATRDQPFGSDVQRIDSLAQLRAELPQRLARGPRVLKQLRGHSGIGVWRVERDPADTRLLQVRHAQRGSEPERLTWTQLEERLAAYFEPQQGGHLIDQAWQPRLVDGMVRAYLVGDRVAGFGHQAHNALHPDQAPGQRLYHGADWPPGQALRARLEGDWIERLCRCTGQPRDALPLLWDVDFLHGEPTADDADRRVLCEVNVSSVAPFPPSCIAPLVQAVQARWRARATPRASRAVPGRRPPMPLHDPARHEALVDTPWDAERVRAAVRQIAARLLAERPGEAAFRVHAQDLGSRPMPAAGLHGVYDGASGVWWALWTLQAAGAIDSDVDFAAAARRSTEALRADADAEANTPSLFVGRVGADLVEWRLAPSRAVEDRLHDEVRANLDHPSQEAFLGAPGTMLAAVHLWHATGEQRWRRLLLDHVDRLWRGWQHDATAGCHLWTQDLYGSTVQYLGAAHGFAGNVFALLSAWPLLDEDRQHELVARVETTLTRLARRDGIDADGDGEAVNWPPGTYTPRPDGPAMLMQWCHGAPGIVGALAPLPPGRSPVIDELLMAAGRAIWRAGALAKGPGLCHGSAGNGQALLDLYRRSGDAVWLARARRFAMHALHQLQQAWPRDGQARASLWTGDAGVALFLHDCVQGQRGWPLLDRI
ncbi:MAG: Cj0069 family protein [Rubrivivax sp.]